MWNHGLAWQIHSVPVGSNDQIAAFLKLLGNIQRSWVARLTDLTSAEPIPRALAAAGAGSPLAPFVPTARDVANQVYTMWGELRSGWPAQNLTTTYVIRRGGKGGMRTT